MTGKATITIDDTEFILNDVWYVPGFPTNLISESIMKRKHNLWFNGWSDNLLWRDSSGHDYVVTTLTRPNGDLPFLKVQTPSTVPKKSLPITNWPLNTAGKLLSTSEAFKATCFLTTKSMAFANSRVVRPDRILTEDAAHSLFGHASLPRIRQLPKAVLEGITIDRSTATTTESTPRCKSCSLSKSREQPSRRERRVVYTPFGYIGMDTIHFAPGYNGHQYLIYGIDRTTGFHFAMTTDTAAESELVSFTKMIQSVALRYNRIVNVISIDDSPTYGHAFG
jgi:hypothetical protein